MAAQSEQEAAAAQDVLRPLRSFVNTLAGIVNDQSWSSQDYNGANPSYRYQTVGPNGVAVEGATYYQTTQAQQGGVTIPSTLLLVGLGAALVWFLK